MQLLSLLMFGMAVRSWLSVDSGMLVPSEARACGTNARREHSVRG